ncbi:MAG: hypothetical protein R3F11_06880 [Verrucomicrobiales bacterium]
MSVPETHLSESLPAMIVFSPKELDPRETRAAITPASAKQLAELGLEVQVESGIGIKSDHDDAEYEAAGAKIAADRAAALGSADIVLRVRKRRRLRSRWASAAVSTSVPRSLQRAGPDQGVRRSLGTTAASLEMIPRSTLAQKMDALSSQDNLWY